MAGPGGNHTPKPPDQRRRRNADPVPWSTIEPDGQLRGPELDPELIPGGWHPRTLSWWETWRRSPQSQMFIDTDWDFLLDTALMHHTMWAKGRWEFAAELRLRAGKMGATPEDRLRLRLTVDVPGISELNESVEPGAGDIRRRRSEIRVVSE
jgi:hypothetical protein